MPPRTKTNKKLTIAFPKIERSRWYVAGATTLCVILVYVIGFSDAFAVEYSKNAPAATLTTIGQKVAAVVAPTPTNVDPATYYKKVLANANYATLATTSTSTPRLWPAHSSVIPKAGALLPYHRIIAYYGNFYSTKMGILGQDPQRLRFLLSITLL
jgi:hypothetical protein